MFGETNQTEEMELPENLFEDENLGEEGALDIEETNPEDFKSSQTLDEAGSEALATPANAEQTMRIKHLGEEMDIPLSEAVILAQKGKDYDFVRGERDNLASVIDAYANMAGMSREDYLEYLQKALEESSAERELEALRGNHPGADDSVLQALRERDAELNKYKTREREQQEEKERLEPWTRFFTNHPEIKPEELPKEMDDLIKSGMTPDEAFLTLKLRGFEGEAAAKKTNEENARRAVGSVAGDGGKAKVDPFLEGFWG